MSVASRLAGFMASGSDKGAHGYGAFYSQLPEPSTMLEIGLAAGYSLRGWRSLWPAVEFFGLDIDCSGFRGLTEPGHVLERDSRLPVPSEWQAVEFDLIIDDASHQLSDQLATARVWRPRLTARGVYVIEDVPSVNLEELRYGLGLGWVGVDTRSTLGDYWLMVLRP